MKENKKVYRKHFCSFASSNMINSLERIERQAKDMGFFDTVTTYTEHDLDMFFKKKFDNILKTNVKGFGYWVWKPQIILQTLEKINEGDILLYCDAGCHLNKDGLDKLWDYFEGVNNSELGIGATQYCIKSENKKLKNINYLEREWVKGDTFDFFNIRKNKNVYNTGQFQAGIIFFQKNKNTIMFIKQWMSIFYEKISLIDDSPSKRKNFAGFIQNTHDQSIFSILLKIQKESPFIIPASEVQQKQWELLKEYPILAKRDRGPSFEKRIGSENKKSFSDNIYVFLHRLKRKLSFYRIKKCIFKKLKIPETKL